MKKKRLVIKKINNLYGDYWIVRNKKKEFLGTFSYVINWKTMFWGQSSKMGMSIGCLRELADAMERSLKRLKSNDIQRRE